MYYNSIPPPVAEATNGALMALSIISVIFFIDYLRHAWIDRYPESSIKFFSYENKTAIGLIVMFSGFAIKTGSAWWALHLFTHGEPARFPLLSGITVSGTLLTIIGIVLTLRALSPYRWSRWRMIWLSLGSIALSIAFAAL